MVDNATPRREPTERWSVWLGEELTGTIEIAERDFPWLTGRWIPTARFDEVATLFARELALSDDDDDADEWEQVYREIWRAGVRLRYPDGRVVPEFLLHIDGDTAWFRWSDQPFAEGGIADA